MPHEDLSDFEMFSHGTTTGERFVARRPGGVTVPFITDLSDSSTVTVEPVTMPTLASARATRSGHDLTDFGVLASFVAEADVTDIFVNGPSQIWVDRGAGPVHEESVCLPATDLRQLAVRLVGLGGRHIDEATPCVDVRLFDGIRIHAVLSPISPLGTLLSIRLPRLEVLALHDLEASGFFSRISVNAVRQLVIARQNLLITGAGGSGKTTFLAALLSGAQPTDRIIAIEDVAELRVAHPHFLSLEARQANLEGAGHVGLERLVREALRMRPDRLVLGECRGAEIRELLAALNTGHDGGAGTLHANSLADVPARIEALGALAAMSPTAVARQTVSAIGTVLHLERDRQDRRLAQMGRFELDDRDRLTMVEIVDWTADDYALADRSACGPRTDAW